MSGHRVLSDEQWEMIVDLLPARTGRRGRPFSDARSMIEGIVYRYRCGIAWPDVLDVFGPWQTIWTRHRHLAGDGTWDRVLERLLTHADAAGIVDWAVSVDSTIVRAHQHATNTATQGDASKYTNPPIEPPDDAIGRSRGGL
ncbi:IS5 family transposase [Gordonia sp. ABSL11-1]|uniref:IS5 family transposase n=1 Tax=Gordonia sp. ABSL11-1 TaxID=3053924 RepID=UPI0025727A49|nr:IS5 family transposase [Gordonia sp. ABSL11-1]MDL9949024.1 IS5 family transposase [Gordonia sp. ABSL11-1]